jgi:HJR/Mrr/RecB family endonuclease
MINELTENDFDKFDIDKNPIVSFFATEQKWFSNDDDSLLGIILLDKTDSDWNYVILSKDEDQRYRAIETKVSFASIEKAEESLTNSIITITKSGKKEESLFNARDSQIIKPSEVIIKDIDDEIKKYFKKHPEKLYDMSPRKFEELIASLLQDFGFDTDLTKATKDGGRDIIASIINKVSNFLIYVECKRYKAENKIGVGIIREVIGVHNIHKPAKSIIVTTSFFTQDAIKEAKNFENQLDLKDFNDLKTWLQKY